MAFFRSLQQSIPSMSSIMDSVSTAVDGLASAVGDATYAVSDQLAEQVSTMMNKAQTEEGGEKEKEKKEEESAGRAKEASGRTGGRRAEEDCSRDRGARPARSAEASAKSDCHQSPVVGILEEGCRKKNTQKVEEGNAEAGGRSDMLVEEGSPKGKSRKQRDASGEGSTPPLHSRAVGGRRSQKAQDETTPSSTDKVTRKDNRIPNTATINGACQRDTPEESSPPYSKLGKDRTRRQSKANVKERTEEENSQENEMVFDTAQTHKETGVLEEESKSPKSEKEETKKAPRVRKSQKESSGKNSSICGDGTKKERSRENTGKDGDLWESSSESNSEKTKKPAESVSVCHSQAATHGPDSQSQHSYGWETQQKYSPRSAQCGGYSSEASTEEANCIQRINRGHALEEQRPPPYQDERGGSRRPPRLPADARRGKREPPSRRSAKRHSHGGRASDDREPEGQKKGEQEEEEEEEDVPSDSTAILGPEDMSAHGSALLLSKGYEPEPLAKYGTLDVAFDYDSGEQRLAVTVTAVTDIPAPRRTGNVSWQVHLVLLPTKQQRAKTGVQKGPCPVFTETFKFTCVESEAIGSYAVRFRLYSVRRMRKERVMGEKVFYLTKLNLQGKMSVPVSLDPGCTLKGCGSLRSVSCSEGVSSYRSAGQASRPEILLGLLYSSTTGRLSVEVIKGSHFRDMAPGKPPTLSDGLFCCLKHLIGGQLYIIPDTYVKLTMMNSMGQEMSKCKTSTCRGRPDPTYQETFAFQVALFQLSEVTLLLSVYCRRGVKRRDRVGGVSLGLNSSGEVETSHWAQMRESEGQQVCRWLTLLDT